MAAPRIRIGISSCLLGEAVRYDGDHKRDVYIARTLSRYVEFVPVCPEVGIGMGVPRPPIQLVGSVEAPRAVRRDDYAIDVTEKLAAYGDRQARLLDDVSGYIFKARSPSCGLADVPVHAKTRASFGRGIYAATFLSHHPWLPAEDELRLADPARRDNFFERVFAYRRWQMLVAAGITAAKLVEFQAAHKYALMAHYPQAVTELGRIVAGAARSRASKVASEYFDGFMATLARPTTPARHENVLRHLAGYLRAQADRDQQRALADAITAFRVARLSRAEVLKQLRRLFRRFPDPYIAQQIYLYPDSTEKRLRGL